MTTKRARTDREDNPGYDARKAKEIFAKKLADDAGGRRSNSQMKRDADLILTLLRDGGPRCQNVGFCSNVSRPVQYLP